MIFKVGTVVVLRHTKAKKLKRKCFVVLNQSLGSSQVDVMNAFGRKSKIHNYAIETVGEHQMRLEVRVELLKKALELEQKEVFQFYQDKKELIRYFPQV